MPTNATVFRSLSAALFTLFVSACSSGSDDPPTPTPTPTSTPTPAPTPPQVLAGLEEKGDLPKLDRSPTLTGPDANANGVRDDIDAILAARITDPSRRSAALQVARALQSSLTVDTTSKAATDTVAQGMMNATKCLYQRFPETEGALSPAAIASELQGMTTNTKARLLAYLKYNKSRDGSVSSLPKGDACE